MFLFSVSFIWIIFPWVPFFYYQQIKTPSSYTLYSLLHPFLPSKTPPFTKCDSRIIEISERKLIKLNIKKIDVVKWQMDMKIIIAVLFFSILVFLMAICNLIFLLTLVLGIQFLPLIGSNSLFFCLSSDGFPSSIRRLLHF